MPAVGARVGDRLVLLVERLRKRQRALCAESVEPVGMPLELGQVVEQRRRLAAAALLHGLDIGPPGLGALKDLPRRLTIRRQPLLALPSLKPEIHTAVALAISGLEVGVHLQVVFGHEVPDGLLALNQHGQGGCLDAPHRQHAGLFGRPRAEGVEPGEVEPDQPVRSLAAASGVRQSVEFARGPQAAEAIADRRGRQGRDPQTVHRLGRPGQVVDLAEDELALTTRVRRADDPRDLSAVQDLLDDAELVRALFVNAKRPFPGQHRQRVAPPEAPAGIDLVGLGKPH